jgi:hypothetical protein
MSIGSIKGNIGGVSQADLIRQQELEEPARRGGNLAGLQVRQVQPPTDSPIEAASARPGAALNSSLNSTANAIDPVADASKSPAAQLQNDTNRMVALLQQVQATAQGNENPAAAAGAASPQAASKGQGVNGAGLAEGAAGARRLDAANDPVRVKDAGETGAARKASSPTDSVSQIMAKVVELQKQLLGSVEERPRGININ